MIAPRRALVRPRVSSPEPATALPLEEEIAAQLDAQAWGVIELCGGAGSGRSTALAHLAHVFADDPSLVLCDEPGLTESETLTVVAYDHLVVYARGVVPIEHGTYRQWHLARWDEDEWIEFLLGAHRDRCASVISRIRGDSRRRRLSGTPVLWRAVLDALAAEDSIFDVLSALRFKLDQLSRADLNDATQWSFEQIIESADAEQTSTSQVFGGFYEGELAALLRQPPVQLLLAADYLAKQLRRNNELSILEQSLPESLIADTGTCLRGDETVLAKLRYVAARGPEKQQPMAVSLLHAAGDAWRPSRGRAPLLTGAHLSRAAWQGVQLRRLKIDCADLSFADLTKARLSNVTAVDATLRGIKLREAYLHRFVASRAIMTGADLSFARAIKADLSGADLRASDLRGAVLRLADFGSADLRNTQFRNANLACAWLQGCQIEDADFTEADLSWTDLSRLVLRTATFTGACLQHAFLEECDLEYMILSDANFADARLRGARLTGSEMSFAHFERADLRAAGLAEIEWEGADLRDADLSGATFHMGSSRSGIVGSTLASEGSRTGFYTDDYDEQGFKAPEEIRKANLCGANLRGAKVADVDFYLVDLRGAKFTDSQASHFRSCGAILESRV